MYRRRKVVKEEKPEIPNTIEEFGYTIKDNDEIRGTHSGNFTKIHEMCSLLKTKMI